MSDKTQTPISELMEQAMKNYEQALQAGLKLQEESSRWWTGLMNPASAGAEWQKRWQKTASQSLPLVQKRMEESLRLVEQSSRTSLDLLKRAIALTASDSSANAQTKLQELWEASLGAVQNNTRAVCEANAKFTEAWMQLFASTPDAGGARTKPN